MHHSSHFPESVRNFGSGRDCDGAVRCPLCYNPWDFLQMYEELNKVTRQIVHESNWRNVGLTILTRASAQERLRFLASSKKFGEDEMEAIQRCPLVMKCLGLPVPVEAEAAVQLLCLEQVQIRGAFNLDRRPHSQVRETTIGTRS